MKWSPKNADVRTGWANGTRDWQNGNRYSRRGKVDMKRRQQKKMGDGRRSVVIPSDREMETKKEDRKGEEREGEESEQSSPMKLVAISTES